MNSKQVIAIGARPQTLDNGSATNQANERGRHGKAEFLVLVRAQCVECESGSGDPRSDQTQCGQHGCSCMDRFEGSWRLHIQLSHKAGDLEEVDAESADAIGALNVSERSAAGVGQITFGISGNEGSGVAELTRHGRTAARVSGSSNKASFKTASSTRECQLDAHAMGPWVAIHTKARAAASAMAHLLGGLGFAGFGHAGNNASHAISGCLRERLGPEIDRLDSAVAHGLSGFFWCSAKQFDCCLLFHAPIVNVFTG